MKDVDLRLIVDGATAMHELVVAGVDVAAGDELLFYVDEAGRRGCSIRAAGAEAMW
jgi:hypothetical protein